MNRGMFDTYFSKLKQIPLLDVIYPVFNIAPSVACFCVATYIVLWTSKRAGIDAGERYLIEHAFEDGVYW